MKKPGTPRQTKRLVARTDSVRAMPSAHRLKLEREIIRHRLTEGEFAQAKSAHAQLRRMFHHVIQGQEEQRKQISKCLHNDVSQLMVCINVHLAVLARAAELDLAGVRRTIEPMQAIVKKSLQVVERFAWELRPASLDDLGFIPALRAYLDDFHRRKGWRIQFKGFAGVAALSSDKQLVFYRVAQEALSNVASHARASTVKVTLSDILAGVCLEISDNGRGFAVGRIGSPAWGRRLGLVTLRERVEMAGGRLTLKSTRGRGTTLRAELPLRDLALT